MTLGSLPPQKITDAEAKARDLAINGTIDDPSFIFRTARNCSTR